MKTSYSYPIILLAVLYCLSAGVLADADELVIKGDAKTVTLSQQELLALDAAPLVTMTPWTDGELTFEGASLEQVLALAGIGNGQLEAMALNGYSVGIPVRTAIEAGAYVAARIDGEPMRVKDKGPFWIVFPWTDQPELLNREVRAWAIWQLSRLTATD